MALYKYRIIIIIIKHITLSTIITVHCEYLWFKSRQLGPITKGYFCFAGDFMVFCVFRILSNEQLRAVLYQLLQRKTSAILQRPNSERGLQVSAALTATASVNVVRVAFCILINTPIWRQINNYGCVLTMNGGHIYKTNWNIGRMVRFSVKRSRVRMPRFVPRSRKYSMQVVHARSYYGLISILVEVRECTATGKVWHCTGLSRASLTPW